MTESDALVYLDHGATTPLDERVLNAMLPYFREEFGNAASKSHRYGWRADEAVANARSEVAALIGAQAKEIIFTSGATEADNLAVLGGARARRDDGRHIVIGATEHKAVLDPARALEREGFRVTLVDVDAAGVCSAARVKAAIEPDTTLVSVMLANNEIGTIAPIAEIAAVCRSKKITFHTDAAQAAGKVEIDVAALDVDLLSLSAHKMYGPKGIGALFVRRRPRVAIEAIQFGGGHERGLRSGTLDVPSIVGFGRAATLARDESESRCAHMQLLRDRLWAALSQIEDVKLHGPAIDNVEARLPDNLNVAFECVEAERLLLALSSTVALSTGSACTSAALAPSHVLRAIACSNDEAHSTVRFGVGRENTVQEIDRVAAAVTQEVALLRTQSSQWTARGGR